MVLAIPFMQELEWLALTVNFTRSVDMMVRSTLIRLKVTVHAQINGGP